MARLFSEAHSQGIRVLLDLVPGHTSEEHPWFLRSSEEEPNEYYGRFIWTNRAFGGGDGLPFIAGDKPRAGGYIINFFKCQPALNYGFRDIHQPWQQPIDSPDAIGTREAMKDVIRFWCDMGCDGFRVDMAASLVKNDSADKQGTQEVWRDILGDMHLEYPDAAFISEWSNPCLSLKCGFDMDFCLAFESAGYTAMVGGIAPDGSVARNPYFSKDSGSDVSRFLADYLPRYYSSRGDGLWCFITCNHDTPRTSERFTETEQRIAYAWVFTMPGAPFLYYGDEIAMKYRKLPTKEGGYYRTGSRTPMQWTRGKNLGFSDASADKLYLPVEEGAEHTVEAQETDPDSMLNYVRSLIALRHSEEDLQSYSPFSVYSADVGSRLFAYKRGKLLVAMNPGAADESCALDCAYRPIFTFGGAQVAPDRLTLSSQSFAVLKPV